MRNQLAIGLVFAVACSGVALGIGNGPDYVKWQQAKALAAETGKPICVFTLVGPKGG